MNRYLKQRLTIVIFISLVLILSGCSGVVTPNISDFTICENLLKGLYAALSSQNFALALSYCKTGGLTFDYVNDLWGLSQQYPGYTAIYQVYDVYDFSYMVGGGVYLCYDYSWTTTTTYYMYGRIMNFVKVNGEWKMV